MLNKNHFICKRDWRLKIHHHHQEEEEEEEEIIRTAVLVSYGLRPCGRNSFNPSINQSNTYRRGSSTEAVNRVLKQIINQIEKYLQYHHIAPGDPPFGQCELPQRKKHKRHGHCSKRKKERKKKKTGLGRSCRRPLQKILPCFLFGLSLFLNYRVRILYLFIFPIPDAVCFVGVDLCV